MLLQTEAPVTYNSIAEFWETLSPIERVNTLKYFELMKPSYSVILVEQGIIALLGTENINDFEVIEWVLKQREIVYDLRLDENDNQFYVTKVNAMPVNNKI